MVSIPVLLALVSLPATLAQQLTVNTPPSVVQCQPIQLGWSGGSPPYFLSLIPAGQVSGAPIKQFPTQNGNTFTWIADLPSGSTFTISLKDKTGATAFSDIVTVQSGPDSGCINTAITEDGSGGSATAGPSGASSGSVPAATTGTPSPASSNGPSASGSAKIASGSPSSTASSTPSNAASHTKGNALAVAGVMGLVGAVLF